MKGASGKKGAWSRTQKAHAKIWAACLASVFEDEEAKVLQARFTKPRMMTFVRNSAKKILFTDDEEKAGANTKWVRALQVAYITFGVNNPKWASEAIAAANANSTQKKWSPAYFVDCLESLTYQKGITIYPHRYDSIRPVLEDLYGIYLPNKAHELKSASVFIDSTSGHFYCLKSIQHALHKLRFKPGKIDGLMGTKTRAATKAFQIANNSESPPLKRLLTNGVLTRKTLSALAKADQLRSVQEETAPHSNGLHEVDEEVYDTLPPDDETSPVIEPVVEAIDSTLVVSHAIDKSNDTHIVIRILLAVWNFFTGNFFKR